MYSYSKYNCTSGVNIKLDGTQGEGASSYKHFGSWIDGELSFEEH